MSNPGQSLLADHERNNLDAIRMALAITVIYSHSYPITTGINDGEWVYRLTKAGTTAGLSAVFGFFVVSGMLITQSWNRTRTLGGFVAKRALRIFPGFIVAVSLCAFVLVPAVGGSVRQVFVVAMAGVRMDALRAAGMFGKNPFPDVVDGSVWTIRYECYCYLLVAALGLAGLLRSGRVVIGIAAAATAALMVASHHTARYGGADVPGLGNIPIWSRLLTPFMAGMILHYYRRRIPIRWWIMVALAIAAVIALRTGARAGGYLALVPAIAYGVIYFGFHPGIKLSRFGRYGDFSYGTYLYAWPVQQLLAVWGVRSVGSMFFLAVPVSLAAGWLSWRCIERPAMSLRPGKVRRPVESRVDGAGSG